MRIVLFSFVLFMNLAAFSQGKGFFKESKLNGSLETNNQYYLNNKRGNILAPEKRFASNTYLTANYQYKGLRAGIQFEGYNQALQGFPTRYEGNKLVRRYIRYTNKKIDVHVGNFFEQFGNGLVFRAFEERSLGLDNNIDGLGIRYSPFQSLKIKAIWGRPRTFMERSPGEVIGGDLEWSPINREKDKRFVRFEAILRAGRDCEVTHIHQHHPSC